MGLLAFGGEVDDEEVAGEGFAADGGEVTAGGAEHGDADGDQAGVGGAGGVDEIGAGEVRAAFAEG